jgi:alkanesulfonate monooxygenase SsuD/methylene tetrahydromethanopterin reductase-like flavin-dependent oxidoreductase (luciferase family)
LRASSHLGDTQQEAQEKADMRAVSAASNIEQRMAQIGWTTNIDFSTHDLDAPVAKLTTNGHQSSLQNFIRKAGGKTLREAVIAHSSAGGSVDLIGTPDSVASQMGDIMGEVGGDGFLIALPNVSRKSVAEITDGLVPALQQRALVRKKYSHAQFRDNLLAF